MARISGLGQNFFIQGRDLSGDVAAIQKCGGGPALLDGTALNSSAMERLAGLKSGEISFQSFLNTAAGQAHPALSPLPTTNVVMSYLLGTTLGDQVACMVAKQMNYDPQRGADGALLFGVQGLSNGAGNNVALEWCEMLTAGKVTHASATNGSSRDYGSVSTLFGASAYWHLFSAASGTVDGSVQDSADNISFADITGLTFAAIASGSAPGAERVATATGATIRRYVRFASSDTFTSAVLFCAFIRHLTSTL